MNLKPIFFVLLIFSFSCKENNHRINNKSEIATKVYQAQMKYLDNTIYNYSRISDKGVFFFEESSYLDSTTKKFQDKIKSGETITEDERNRFFGHFEMIFKTNALIDLDIFQQLKGIPIKSVSDVDILKLYIKNNFVCILLNNKLLPYNSWSIMASTNEVTIKQGEPFEVLLANTAWNSAQPNEWFLVKNSSDGLDANNIIDTLHQEESGVVYFKTATYKKGRNKLIFISKLNTPEKDRVLSREVTFIVK